MVKSVLSFILKVYYVLDRPYIKGLPGELAFFFMWSVAPLVILLGYFVSLFNINIDNIMDMFGKYAVPQFVDLIDSFLNQPPTQNSFIIFLFLSLLFSSRGVIALIRASNLVYGVEKRYGYIGLKLKSIVMTFIIIVLILILLITPVLGQFIFSFIFDLFQLSKFAQLFWNVFGWAMSLFLVLVGIQFLYVVAPNQQVLPRNAKYGAVFTTFGWIISSVFFSYYLAHYANYDQFYGSFANIVILMFWFYILAFVYVIGLAINVVMSER